MRATIIGFVCATVIGCAGNGGGSANDLTSTTSALTGAPANAAEVLGFESAADWSPTTSGTMIGLSSNHTQGVSSLSVRPSASQNWNQLVSVPLSTLGPLSTTIDLDVLLPLEQPNPYWLGAVQMYVTCPSHNIYNAYLAEVELSGQPLGVWNTLSFPLTTGEVSSLLGSGYTDLTLSVALNVPFPTTGTYLFDNLRFVPLGAAACGGQPDGSLCTDGNACTTVDTCQGGTCSSGAPVACAASDACHQAGVCDPGTGLCSGGAAAPDWTPCTDGDLCTHGQACQAGVCTGGQPSCDDGDPCTADSCDPTSGSCQFTPGQCAAPLTLAARVSFTAESDNNRCVPDAEHVLNRMNARGELMGWQYAAANYPPVDSDHFHNETIVRLPYFDPSVNSNLDGSYFVSTFSHPAAGDTDSLAIFGSQLGVAHLGFKGGNQGKMLLTNRAFSTGNHSSTDAPDWLVTPHPNDTFIPMGNPAVPFLELDPVLNHPGGASALGWHVVIPLQDWVENTGVGGFFCDLVGEECDGATPGGSQPKAQIWNLSAPQAPQLSSAFLTHFDPVPDGSGGNSAVAAAITKLNNGHFLLAFLKDTPVAQLELYVSASIDIDDANLFGAQRVPDAIVPTCTNGGALNGCAANPYDWQSFNFITGCDGNLFILGMRGDVNGDDDDDVLDNFAVQLANGGTGGTPAYSVTLTRVDQLGAVGGVVPEGFKHMYCSDNSNTDQCDFQAAAGTYVDPNGQLIVYATDYDDDGGATSFVYGNGAGDTGGPWLGQSCPTGTCPAEGGYYRGVEFHERHGNAASPSACPTMDDAWVELYADTGFNNGGDTNGQLFRSNYTTRDERNGYLGANDFNDKASSVRWCLPSGASIQIFRDFWQGPFTYLNGNGHVAGITDLGAFAYPYTTDSNAPGGSLAGSFTTFQFVPGYSDPQGLPGVPDGSN